MRPDPAVTLAVSFIDCINRGDVAGLRHLMTVNHTLRVLDESPVVGRSANVDAWRGYFDRFPDYMIHSHCITDQNDTVAILGHTTGSHLDLPDAEEELLTLIRLAVIVDGAVQSGSLIDDTPDNRHRVGIDATA